jgi:hypothetical protein
MNEIILEHIRTEFTSKYVNKEINWSIILLIILCKIFMSQH